MDEREANNSNQPSEHEDLERVPEQSPDDAAPRDDDESGSLTREDRERLLHEAADKIEVRDAEPENDPDEKRSSSSGLSPLMIAAALVLGLVAMAYFMPSSTGVEIPYSELERLIEQGAPSKNADAHIDIEVGTGDEKLTVRYSNLHDLRFGPGTIAGKVTREVIEPEDKKSEKPEEDVRFYTARLGLNDFQNTLYAKAIENGFEDIRGQSEPSGWEQYGPFLLMLAIMALFFILIFRRMGGAGAMAFGRSRGRFIELEKMTVTFDDVAGVEEAVDELREVVEFLRTPDKYHKLGGRIPRGVLLVGPPGTGKTLLAKAVAGEAGVPFLSLSGSDFVEMFVGVGAARVRDMFQQAQQRSPCIIFIDELDALGKTRGAGNFGGHDEREQTLNALLVEMDGFNSDGGTIIMGATNRPETLDAALLRPGRFDRQVLVDRPDIRGREAILKVHIEDVKIDDSVDLKRIAAITPGFVGADLAALVNEAALLAARAGKSCVTMQEFTEGVERVTAGLEKRQRVMHEDEKLRVAYHESGHALVAHLLPNTDPVHKVSIIPRGMAALGYTMQRPEEERYLVTKSELESRIQVLLAGTVAEDLVFQDVSSGAQNDLERATEIARAMVMDFGMSRLGPVTYRENPRGGFLGQDGFPRPRQHSEQTAREIDEEIRSIIEGLLEGVRGLLRERFDDLERLSQGLLEKETIDSSELLELLGGPSSSPHGDAEDGDATLDGASTN